MVRPEQGASNIPASGRQRGRFGLMRGQSSFVTNPDSWSPGIFLYEILRLGVRVREVLLSRNHLTTPDGNMPYFPGLFSWNKGLDQDFFPPGSHSDKSDLGVTLADCDMSLHKGPRSSALDNLSDECSSDALSRAAT